MWNRYHDELHKDTLTLRRLDLVGEVISLFRPAELAQKEAAIHDGNSYGFAESVSRTFNTSAGFVGCVAVEYKNDDGSLNPGEEQGTQSRLFLAGCIGNKLVHYSGEPYYVEHASSILDPDELISAALTEVVAALQPEKQQSASEVTN